jgi:hypothetical protein
MGNASTHKLATAHGMPAPPGSLGAVHLVRLGDRRGQRDVDATAPRKSRYRDVVEQECRLLAPHARPLAAQDETIAAASAADELACGSEMDNEVMAARQRGTEAANRRPSARAFS